MKHFSHLQHKIPIFGFAKGPPCFQRKTVFRLSHLLAHREEQIDLLRKKQRVQQHQ